ncbi:MAG: hypothetical protein JWO36_6119 [Myxococcales bacterium]|nr:hypothetical protein [Myxococcales bacterium]
MVVRIPVVEIPVLASKLEAARVGPAELRAA